MLEFLEVFVEVFVLLLGDVGAYLGGSQRVFEAGQLGVFVGEGVVFSEALSTELVYLFLFLVQLAIEFLELAVIVADQVRVGLELFLVAGGAVFVHLLQGFYLVLCEVQFNFSSHHEFPDLLNLILLILNQFLLLRH
jgi:hypothetical protein